MSAPTTVRLRPVDELNIDTIKGFMDGGAHTAPPATTTEVVRFSLAVVASMIAAEWQTSTKESGK